MDDDKNQPEPTMEEILASIRRIISEDGQEGEKAEQKDTAADQPDDILELTEMADEPEPDSGDLDIPERVPVDFPSQAESDSGPVPEPEPGAAPPKLPTDDEAIVSPGPAAASTAAFAGLLGALDRTQGIGGDMPIGNSGLTLEELVRQMMRPMLREWLDNNLPGIVERLVKREIERMVRRAGD